MYLEEWAMESADGTSAKAHASCWGIHRSTHWRWVRRPRPVTARRPRLAEARVKAVLEIDRRYRSSWDARAVAFVTGVGKTSVAKILRLARGPRPKPRRARHDLRTRFLARDVMWSSDAVELPDGRKLMKTLDEASDMRLGWDLVDSESAAAVVRHARAIIDRMRRVPMVWKHDHGKGFTSHAFQALLAEHGIASFLTPPRAPWANGRTERDHQEILNWLALSTAKSAEEVARDIDDGMLMLNFVKPRAALGFKTSAKAYFDAVAVPEIKKIEFRERLRRWLAGSRDERLQRRAIRTILAELGLYEEWLQAGNGREVLTEFRR